jgi:hypothetical protein
MTLNGSGRCKLSGAVTPGLHRARSSVAWVCSCLRRRRSPSRWRQTLGTTRNSWSRRRPRPHPAEQVGGPSTSALRAPDWSIRTPRIERSDWQVKAVLARTALAARERSGRPGDSRPSCCGDRRRWCRVDVASLPSTDRNGIEVKTTWWAETDFFVSANEVAFSTSRRDVLLYRLCDFDTASGRDATTFMSAPARCG